MATWQFSCSHNSCKGERSTWKAFKAAHGIANKVYPQPSTQDTLIYTDADIDTVEDAGSSASVPVIPDIVFDGVFGEYRDAFKEKTEVPDAFHFGVLKSIIAGMLGRRVFLDETQPLFPNTYAAVIGETGLARKSTAVNLGVDVMESADETTLFIDTISTPEGLYNMFVQPRQDEDDDGNTTYSGGMSEYVPVDTLLEMMQETSEKEGFRIFAYIDELSATLKKGRKASSEGIVQALLSLYNAPRKVMSPTKTNPTTAYNPCFSLVAATTFEAFQADMTLEDIHAGAGEQVRVLPCPHRQLARWNCDSQGHRIRKCCLGLRRI